jgi:uncharacterized protein (TIGR02118 family)
VATILIGGMVEMAKMIFFLTRRAELTREEMVEQWSGQQHRSVVWKILGLSRWTQNRITSAPGEPPCDAIGELWFESDEALQQALTSPEWSSAVEDAGRFLDLGRSGLIIVEEKPVPDLAHAGTRGQP